MRPGLRQTAVDAMRALRQATDKALPEAFTLNGLILLRMVVQAEAGKLPVNQRTTLDGAGQAISVSVEELAHESVLWLERAYTFHDIVGTRLLAMSHARGLGGKVDYPSVRATALQALAATRRA